MCKKQLPTNILRSTWYEYLTPSVNWGLWGLTFRDYSIIIITINQRQEYTTYSTDYLLAAGDDPRLAVADPRKRAAWDQRVIVGWPCWRLTVCPGSVWRAGWDQVCGGIRLLTGGRVETSVCACVDQRKMPKHPYCTKKSCRIPDTYWYILCILIGSKTYEKR